MVPAAAPPAVTTLPAAAHLRALEELVDLGYLRGLLDKLAEIDALDAGHGEFAARLRTLARQFQFDAINAPACPRPAMTTLDRPTATSC